MTYLTKFYQTIVCLLLLLMSGLFLPNQLQAQDQDALRIGGDIEARANFFIRDSLIGAANTPQYDRQLYGAQAWVNLTASYKGFDAGMRFDIFNNTNLLNPTGSYTAQGIGRWYISRKVKKLGITAGYLYDQIGSGIIYRSYEQRALLIDNALAGLRLTYDLTPDWQIKAFTGRMKFFSQDRANPFDTYDSPVRGLNIEGFVSGKEGSGVSFAPGFGAVSRTLDDASMSGVVGTLNTYTPEEIFEPKYNAYAFTLYNTLTAGPISWYIEGAYKTDDIMNDPNGIFTNPDGSTFRGDKYIQKSGSVLYSSLSYAKSGLGVTLEAKRTENFTWRTRPQAQLNRGLIGFLPPMTRINTFRLNARYNAATQELGELAFQVDANYKINKKTSVGANYSRIDDLDGNTLYRELYTQFQYKQKRDWYVLGGVQFQTYNQEVYEGKPQVPNVETIIPYVEFLNRFTRKKSLRVEAQYMITGDDKQAGFKQDYGDWAFLLAEFSFAPHWTFTISDMYNVTPGKLSPTDEKGEKESLHYPRFDVFYTHRANRFSLSYVKQVEGVVCTGGICRLEPAFSGVQLGVSSSF